MAATARGGGGWPDQSVLGKLLLTESVNIEKRDRFDEEGDACDVSLFLLATVVKLENSVERRRRKAGGVTMLAIVMS